MYILTRVGKNYWRNSMAKDDVEAMKAAVLKIHPDARNIPDNLGKNVIVSGTPHWYNWISSDGRQTEDEAWADAHAKLPADASPSEPQDEQPTISVLFRQQELMPDGSLGAVFIGEFAGDRSKDLRLTIAQAQTLADQITQKVGNHTIFEQGAPPNAQQ